MNVREDPLNNGSAAVAFTVSRKLQRMSGGTNWCRSRSCGMTSLHTGSTSYYKHLTASLLPLLNININIIPILLTSSYYNAFLSNNHYLLTVVRRRSSIRLPHSYSSGHKCCKSIRVGVLATLDTTCGLVRAWNCW